VAQAGWLRLGGSGWALVTVVKPDGFFEVERRMRSLPQTGDPLFAESELAPRRGEDRVYQLVTVVAILAVLATVWIF
jgi:hypothetical protein